MNDDPMVWLVDEFGANACITEPSRGFAYIPIDRRFDEWMVCYQADADEWEVCDHPTKAPLTRDDVRRLCEIFGVEVKK